MKKKKQIVSRLLTSFLFISTIFLITGCGIKKQEIIQPTEEPTQQVINTPAPTSVPEENLEEEPIEESIKEPEPLENLYYIATDSYINMGGTTSITMVPYGKLYEEIVDDCVIYNGQMVLISSEVGNALNELRYNIYIKPELKNYEVDKESKEYKNILTYYAILRNYNNIVKKYPDITDNQELDASTQDEIISLLSAEEQDIILDLTRCFFESLYEISSISFYDINGNLIEINSLEEIVEYNNQFKIASEDKYWDLLLEADIIRNKEIQIEELDLTKNYLVRRPTSFKNTSTENYCITTIFCHEEYGISEIPQYLFAKTLGSEPQTILIDDKNELLVIKKVSNKQLYETLKLEGTCKDISEFVKNEEYKAADIKYIYNNINSDVFLEILDGPTITLNPGEIVSIIANDSDVLLCK